MLILESGKPTKLLSLHEYWASFAGPSQSDLRASVFRDDDIWAQNGEGGPDWRLERSAETRIRDGNRGNVEGGEAKAQS